MSEENKDGVSDSTSDVRDDDAKEETVSAKEFKKLLGQRKADQEKNAELVAKVAKFESKEQSAKEQKLKDDAQWEKLAGEKDEQLKKERAEKEGYQSALTDSAKLQAVASHLPAKFKKDEYYDFVPLAKVELNSETGVVDSDSAKAVADSIVENYSELLDFKDGKTLPNDGNSSSSKKLSYDNWLKLPLKERKAKMGEVHKQRTT